LKKDDPVIAPLKFKGEVLFSSPEITPVYIEAITEPAKIFGFPPYIEVPV
jgi:hypothetical protein